MLKKQDSGETSHLFVCFLRSFVVLACSVCLFFVVLFVRLFNFLPKVKHNACFEQRIGLSDGSVLFDEQKKLGNLIVLNVLVVEENARCFLACIKGVFNQTETSFVSKKL